MAQSASFEGGFIVMHAGAIHKIGTRRPAFQQMINLRHQRAAGHRALIDQATQFVGQPTADRRRLTQIPDCPGTVEVGEGLGGGGQREGGEFAVEGVLGEVEVAAAAGGEFAEGAGLAVAAGVGAGGALDVAAGEGNVGGGAGEGDAGDAGGAQGLQFVGLAEAVLVEVAPQAQGVELAVEGAELAVAVAVEIGQRGKAVGGFLSVGEDGVDAKQLAAVIDAAIAVFVEGEKGVIAGEPAGAAARAVAVVIEEDGVAAGDADGFEAVTVEIEGEGVDAGTPAAGAEVEVVERRVFCAMGGGYEKIEYQLKRIDIKQAT